MLFPEKERENAVSTHTGKYKFRKNRISTMNTLNYQTAATFLATA